MKLANKNGPLQIEGNIEVVTGTGRTILRTRTTALCRCGNSANKPYCDGTHSKIGFVAEPPDAARAVAAPGSENNLQV